jgi:hypothetical protein
MHKTQMQQWQWMEWALAAYRHGLRDVNGRGTSNIYWTWMDMGVGFRQVTALVILVPFVEI